VDRIVIMPTAETQPEGSFTFSSMDIIVLQASYAVSDSTQLTLTLTPPIEGFFPSDFSIKSRIARGEYFRLAALGAVSGAVSSEDGWGWIGRAGFVGQACFDAGCRSSATLGLNVVLLGPASMLATGFGVTGQLSDSVAMLGEIDILTPSSRDVAEYQGITAAAGIRWSNAHWGLDATVVTSLTGGGSFPLLVGTYRVLPD
jgi:hypothetical protein